MSQLPAEVTASIQQLLEGLASSDNTTRQNAEKTLNNDWVAQQPDVLLLGLAEQTQAAPEARVSGIMGRGIVGIGIGGWWRVFC